MHFLISPTDWGLDRLKDKNPTQISASLLVSTIFWSRSRKYTFFWSQSRIFMNKSLGLACWDCTCSVSVFNLKNWSRRSQISFVGKSLILSYGFGPKSSSLLQIDIEATERSARLSVWIIFLVSVLVSKIHISWSRSQSRIFVTKSVGLACWNCISSVSVLLVETVPTQSRSRSRTLNTGLADLWSYWFKLCRTIRTNLTNFKAKLYPEANLKSVNLPFKRVRLSTRSA